LYRRKPDERFDSFESLYRRCQTDRELSEDQWVRPEDLILTHDLTVAIGDNPDYTLNDWSFSQLCRMASVSRDTLNRLTSRTASRALEETLPKTGKPLQLLTRESSIRSVHGVSYTRLWNVELLDLVREFAPGFEPPQKAADGSSTGLYCGEQDMFAFLIDPTGWAEIDGEAFAPGFFLWNSEVGRRSLGVQTFWFQAICQNHIVWDAVEVVEFSRKHTANVRDGLPEIGRILEALAAKRDARRDGFVSVMRKAMSEKLGDDVDEASKRLAQEGFPKGLVKEAMQIAEQQGRFTIFALVDALTRLSQRITLAGDRVQLDAKIGQLLSLAA
jgi:histone H3/H4